VITLARSDRLREVAALLPIDHTLRARLLPARSAASARRALREDGLADDAEKDDARDLCRLGLIGCTPCRKP